MLILVKDWEEIVDDRCVCLAHVERACASQKTFRTYLACAMAKREREVKWDKVQVNPERRFAHGCVHCSGSASCLYKCTRRFKVTLALRDSVVDDLDFMPGTGVLGTGSSESFSGGYLQVLVRGDCSGPIHFAALPV